MFAMADMFEIFQKFRGNSVVIPGRGAKHWRKFSDFPQRAVPLGDPAMGGHSSFAMGLALAQPSERIILFDSEGDILMNLGALVTIAEKPPKNFYHFLLDNECYATTGGQPVPNAKNVSYAGLAIAAGYPNAYSFDDLEDFANNIESILDQPGPVLVAMKVLPEIENLPIAQRPRFETRSREEILNDLRNELGITS